jgi:hypothetical protein
MRVFGSAHLPDCLPDLLYPIGLVSIPAPMTVGQAALRAACTPPNTRIDAANLLGQMADSVSVSGRG